jgi:hypothetical protein
VRSEIGEGTTVTMRIPLQSRFEVMGRSLETMAHHNCDHVLATDLTIRWGNQRSR